MTAVAQLRYRREIARAGRDPDYLMWVRWETVAAETGMRPGAQAVAIAVAQQAKELGGTVVIAGAHSLALRTAQTCSPTKRPCRSPMWSVRTRRGRSQGPPSPGMHPRSVQRSLQELVDAGLLECLDPELDGGFLRGRVGRAHSWRPRFPSDGPVLRLIQGGPSWRCGCGNFTGTLRQVHGHRASHRQTACRLQPTAFVEMPALPSSNPDADGMVDGAQSRTTESVQNPVIAPPCVDGVAAAPERAVCASPESHQPRVLRTLVEKGVSATPDPSTRIGDILRPVTHASPEPPSGGAGHAGDDPSPADRTVPLCPLPQREPVSAQASPREAMAHPSGDAKPSVGRERARQLVDGLLERAVDELVETHPDQTRAELAPVARSLVAGRARALVRRGLLRPWTAADVDAWAGGVAPADDAVARARLEGRRQAERLRAGHVPGHRRTADCARLGCPPVRSAPSRTPARPQAPPAGTVGDRRQAALRFLDELVAAREAKLRTDDPQASAAVIRGRAREQIRGVATLRAQTGKLDPLTVDDVLAWYQGELS